jgi:hypothetical protein
MSRLGGTRLIMVSVLAFMLGALVQRARDVAAMRACVSVLGLAREVVEQHASERPAESRLRGKR